MECLGVKKIMNFLFFVQINDIIMYKKNERELFTIKEETYSFQKNKKEICKKMCEKINFSGRRKQKQT